MLGLTAHLEVLRSIDLTQSEAVVVLLLFKELVESSDNNTDRSLRYRNSRLFRPDHSFGVVLEHICAAESLSSDDIVVFIETGAGQIRSFFYELYVHGIFQNLFLRIV